MTRRVASPKISAVDMTGQRFGRLVAIAPTDERRNNAVVWTFACDCGAVVRKSGSSVRTGNTKSCGCFQRDGVRQRSTDAAGCKHHLFKHGRSSSPEYHSWNAAKNRCHNPKNPKYPTYGARGIVMCERWRNSFEAFCEDMGSRPAGTTLDRIDNDRGYEPDNCRWATPKEQSTNRPSWTNFISHDGETMSITDWAARLGIARRSLYNRLERMPVENALQMPRGGRRARD